jgi:hypothetical protein
LHGRAERTSASTAASDCTGRDVFQVCSFEDFFEELRERMGN